MAAEDRDVEKILGTVEREVQEVNGRGGHGGRGGGRR